MEIFNNKICVSYTELTNGDCGLNDVVKQPIMSASAYRQYVHRGQMVIARRGCYCQEALVEYDSLPDRFKARVVAKYGDSTKRAADDGLRRRIVKDFCAEAFFEKFSPRGNDYEMLDKKYVYQYTQDASVLNAVLAMAADMKLTVNRTNGSTKHIWTTISTLVNGLQQEFGCKLPQTAITLKRKALEYQKDGYISLVSGKFCNNNRRKNKKEEQEALIVELLSNGRNMENAQIARLYNITAERMGWDTISERTVANYKNEHPEAFPGRHGAAAYYNMKAMQVKRKRPSAPMLMWSADGWDTELLFQEKVERGKEKGKTTNVTVYHQRPTVIVITDPFCDYPVGYAIGRRETPELIRAAYRNAFKHVKSLFGAYYKPIQLQTDNYAKKTLSPMYEESTKHYTPAAVGNAKAKPVEPFFLQWNRRQFRGYRNSSGYGIKSNTLMQPSPNFIEQNKRHFPDWAGVCEQIRIGIENERAALRDEYIQHWNAMPDDRKLEFTDADFIRLYGDRTEKPHKLHGHGITLQLDGEQYVYDCFNPAFRNYGHCAFILAYDPEDMTEVVAMVAGGTQRNPEETGVRFVLERKYEQPMALADRKPGDAEQLQRIRNYNRERTDTFIELRSRSAETVRRMYDENKDRLLTDTTMKMLITDSTGQHKDVRNEVRGISGEELRGLEGKKRSRTVMSYKSEAEDVEEYEFDPIATLNDI